MVELFGRLDAKTLRQMHEQLGELRVQLMPQHARDTTQERTP